MDYQKNDQSKALEAARQTMDSQLGRGATTTKEVGIKEEISRLHTQCDGVQNTVKDLIGKQEVMLKPGWPNKIDQLEEDYKERMADIQKADANQHSEVMRSLIALSHNLNILQEQLSILITHTEL